VVAGSSAKFKASFSSQTNAQPAHACSPMAKGNDSVPTRMMQPETSLYSAGKLGGTFIPDVSENLRILISQTYPPTFPLSPLDIHLQVQPTMLDTSDEEGAISLLLRLLSLE